MKSLVHFLVTHLSHFYHIIFTESETSCHQIDNRFRAGMTMTLTIGTTNRNLINFERWLPDTDWYRLAFLATNPYPLI